MELVSSVLISPSVRERNSHSFKQGGGGGSYEPGESKASLRLLVRARASRRVSGWGCIFVARVHFVFPVQESPSGPRGVSVPACQQRLLLLDPPGGPGQPNVTWSLYRVLRGGQEKERRSGGGDGMRDEESEDLDNIRFLWTKEASLLTDIFIIFIYVCF